MRGFQERYSASDSHGTAEGIMLNASEGSEHLELLKSHENAHGYGVHRCVL